MAIYPGVRGKPINTMSSALLSTNADGITGADIVDMGGANVCGLEVSTLTSDANYSFRVSQASSTGLKTMRTSTGGVVTIGTTGAGITPGQYLGFDASLSAAFAGVRFVQVFSGIPGTAIAAASSGAWVGVVGAFGPRPI